MVNSIYKFRNELRKSAGLYGGSFKPVEPFENSLKAQSLEQEEVAAEMANSPENQLQGAQKMQQDTANKYMEAQQQIQQLQGELQSSKSEAKHLMESAKLQAAQELHKVQMEADRKLQDVQLKGHKALLSAQEKHMQGLAKAPKDQNDILENHLQRVTARIQKLTKQGGTIIDAEFTLLSSPKSAAIMQESPGKSDIKPIDTNTAPTKPTSLGVQPGQVPASASPHAKVPMAQRTPAQIAERQQYFAQNKGEVAKTMAPSQSGNSMMADNAKQEFGSYWEHPTDYINKNMSSTAVRDAAENGIVGQFGKGENSNAIERGLGSMARGFARGVAAPVDWLKNFAVGTGANAVGTAAHTTHGVYDAGKALSNSMAAPLDYAKDTYNALTARGEGAEQKAYATRDKNWNNNTSTGAQAWDDAKNHFGTAAGNLGNYGMNMTAFLGPAGAGLGNTLGRATLGGALSSSPGQPTTSPETSSKPAAPNTSSPGRFIPSFGSSNNPNYMPMLQHTGGMTPNAWAHPQMGMENQQGYGQAGDFMKSMLFDTVMPALGMQNPLNATPNYSQGMQGRMYQPLYK
jgi:hypothetical protein